MNKVPLNEALSNRLYSVFRSVGVSLSITQAEALRAESDKLANTIEAYVKLSIIEKIEAIQKPITDAFAELEKKLEPKKRAPRKKAPTKKKEE